jgi:FixJ family two-component response regulator
MCATVCIVDDDEGMREVLAQVVRKAGLTSELYDSAEAFLQRPDCSDIDCLLLDLHLDGMSGLALLARLSRGEPPFPVFLISAAHDADTASRARQLGASVVDKPFDTRILSQRILAAIGSDRQAPAS